MSVPEVEGLPQYEALDVEKIQPSMEQLLDEGRKEIDIILRKAGDELSWKSFAEALEEIDDRITKTWSPISHMNSVVNTDELRDAHDAVLPELSRFNMELLQSRPLYDGWLNLKQSDEANHFDSAQQKIVQDTLRDFELAGVALDEASRTELQEIQKKLSLLSSAFGNNALKATDAWSKLVTDRAELDGIPDPNVAVAREAAQAKGEEGWLLTLEMPSYTSAMQHANSRELRQELHHAYMSRASDVGPNAGEFDNSENIAEILELRRRKAQLLGFDSFADLSVEKKMAASGAEVRDFQLDLLSRALPRAKREIEELREFAQSEYDIDELQPWDLIYVRERLKERKYAVKDSELKPYFPIDAVVSGMFRIVEQMYGIEINECDAPSRWHDDVRFYEILRDDERIAQFYLDAFSRPKKRSGAWMADCRVRRESGNFMQLPVAYLTCNFTPPVDGNPSLLTHSEVVTLFHEFGHGLHHMLTKQRYFAVSGINGVAWDAVELPSQFMENWCWQADSVAMISSHYETGESLPQELLDKLLAAKNFGSATAMVRQLEFGLFDIVLHMSMEPVEPLDVLREVREQTALVPSAEYDRFPMAFGHIFAGGYAAGYYSYLWAEVLSADAFAAFEEEGLFEKNTASKFLKEVLEVGGSVDAAKMFENFRGRAPDPAALLRHNGLN